MKRLYVAATERSTGKTTLCLGLLAAFRRRKLRVAFMKPVGQRCVWVDGVPVDTDVALMRSVFCLPQPVCDMSPLIVLQGTTRRFLDGRLRDLETLVRNAAERLCAGADLLLIEGTGHAGVGSVLKLSNARVARLLNAHVLLVANAGIGRTIDELALNLPLFRNEELPIAGVVVNKVEPRKAREVYPYIEKGLRPLRVRSLGWLPEKEFLSGPTMREIVGLLDARILCGKDCLDTVVLSILIATGYPHTLMSRFAPSALVIADGDREDIILAVMNSNLVARRKRAATCLCLTGGVLPHPKIRRLIAPANVPVICVRGDSYTVASRINDALVKISPEDVAKISLVKRLVEKHLDVNSLLASLPDR
ncbi:MAG: AAA family ATPase [Planctomycetota bacterium]